MHDFDFERRQEVLRRMQNLDDATPTVGEFVLGFVAVAVMFLIAGFLI